MQRLGAAVFRTRHGSGWTTLQRRAAATEGESGHVNRVKRVAYPVVGGAAAIGTGILAFRFYTERQMEAIAEAARQDRLAREAKEDQDRLQAELKAERKAAEAEAARLQAIEDARLAEERRLADIAAAEAAAEAEAVRVASEAAAVVAAEEARKAKIEAEEEAARLAALVATVSTALDAARVPGADAAPLIEALQVANEGGVMAADSVIAAGLARVDELRRAGLARTAHAQSLDEVQDAARQHDIDELRKALEKAKEAEDELASIGECEPEGVEIALQGREQLAKLEFLEAQAARYSVAMEQLKAAVGSRDSTRCAEALQEAEAVGAEPGPLMELAAVLAVPGKLHEVLVEEFVSNSNFLYSLRGAEKSEGLRVDDFVAAAVAASESLSEEELRKKVVDLSRATANHRTLFAREAAASLEVAQAELHARASGRMEESLQRLNAAKDEAEQHHREALERHFAEKTEQSVKDALAQVAAHKQEQKTRMREEAQAALEKKLIEERKFFQSRLAALRVPLAHMDELVSGASSPEKRAHTSSALAAALLSLDHALVEGRASGKDIEGLIAACVAIRSSSGDGFPARVAESLPGAIKNAGLMLTEPQLQQSFRDQVRGFTAAAFAPPPAADGDEHKLEMWLRQLAGKAAGKLYWYTGIAVESGGGGKSHHHLDPAAPPTRRMADALHEADRLVAAGSLKQALALLEDRLSGECRKQAEQGWMRTARNALLVHQSVQAMQAKVRCLNSVLV